MKDESTMRILPNMIQKMQFSCCSTKALANQYGLAYLECGKKKKALSQMQNLEAG